MTPPKLIFGNRLRRINSSSAANRVLPVTGINAAVGGALCPDSNTAFSSCVQDRGVKPLLQLRIVSCFLGGEWGGTLPSDFAKATTDQPDAFSPARIAPTRPEVGFHLSVRAVHQQNDCLTEWIRLRAGRSNATAGVRRLSVLPVPLLHRGRLDLASSKSTQAGRMSAGPRGLVCFCRPNYSA
jgi:hypothetical protein